MTTEPRQIAWYGWKPSLPSLYDRKFKLPERGIILPRYKLLIDECPPIWNQGGIGSCTGHGAGRNFAHSRRKQGLPDFNPSRLFIYFGGRSIEGTVKEDAGSSVRDVIKGIVKWGVPPEELWPYDIKKFAYEPPPEAYVEAEKHQGVKYEALSQDLYALKTCLALGFTFTFGFAVYSNFEDDVVSKTGLMSMPAGNEAGGHCVCAVGYNSHNYICCANSWGDDWGDPDSPGHFWMPPEYILHPQLASDFWVIQSVEA
jgi:C1A family cysteine protease